MNAPLPLPPRKRALITGITGQDGSYLAELLLGKGYEVWGLIRRSSSFNTQRIEHLYASPQEADRLHLVYGDLHDGASLLGHLNTIRPDEIYNLGAQSHVRVSFDQPVYTAEIDAIGTLRLLEAVRTLGTSARFYQASTSEMFGSAPAPQSIATPFEPRSPYAVSKVFSHHIVANYREAYGLFAVSGILFNHESPRRGETFVTRKITRALTRIRYGLQKKLYLGNLDAKRDWGFAGDYVDAMWRMLQQETPRDFVIATGETWSIRDFLDAASAELGFDWRPFVEIDPRYYRPTEVDVLQGDAGEARRALDWAPKTSFADLVKTMVAHDLELARRERVLQDVGCPNSRVEVLCA